MASPSTRPSASLCLSLETLSSDGSAGPGPGDVSTHPICISDMSVQSGDLDQELSGDDLPSSFNVDLVSPASPPVPARVQHFIKNYVPPVAPVTLTAESSAPISPNRVRSDCTSGTLDAGPVFDVSQDTAGFLLRAGDTARQALPICSPAPLGTTSDCPPQLGEAVAFKLSRAVQGLDDPVMSFPVYPLPFGMVLMPVSCSSQTMLAPGVPSQQGRWSSAMPQTRDVSREAPFDTYCSPMDTGDCPLASMGLPGCPCRITSYTDRRMLILTRHSAFSCITHGFWSSLGHLSQPGCYSVIRPFGSSTWIWRKLSRPPFTCNVMPV